MRTAIVVPCCNEAERLNCDAFESALAQDPLLQFVFVNDGSTDATTDVLHRLQQRAAERAYVIDLDRNMGKANAVRAGVLLAFDLDAALIGYWDADLATPLECIEIFANELEARQVSLILGSRVRLMGRDISRRPARHYIGRCFATLAAFSLGFAVYDTQCGAKLFRASPVFQAAFSKAFKMTWTFDVELLHRLTSEAARVGGFELEHQCVEFPLPQWIDKPNSKLKIGHYPRLLIEMAQLVAWGLFPKTKLH